MSGKTLSKPYYKPVNDIFSTEEERYSKEFVKELPIDELVEFSDHPFHVEDDLEMTSLIESIRESGQLVPILVRPRSSGKYEIISGHRRTLACRKAGLTSVSAIIRELTDDEATILMVDSNLQREKILPSEKAYAYKMKYEALKHQGKRNDLTSRPGVAKLDNGFTDSKRMIERYIRLTYLSVPLLDMADRDMLSVKAAVQLSYLTEKEQKLVYEALDGRPLTVPQAEAVHRLSEEKTLNRKTLDAVIRPQKVPASLNSVSLGRVRDYFPADYTKEKICEIIYSLLDDWKKSGNIK